MRVLFTSADWTGHVFPMVPLGWALQAAGHEVRVLCSSGIATAVARAGLTPMPLLETTGAVQARLDNQRRALAGTPRGVGLPGMDPFTGAELEPAPAAGGRRAATDTGAVWSRNPAATAAATRGWLRRRASVLEGLARTWRPDLVVHDLCSIDGRVVAEFADVPAVCHLWGLVADAETDPAMDYRPEQIDPSFADWGLTGRGARITRVIDPTPVSIEPPTHAERLRMRYVPYNGIGAMPPWVLAPRSRPRVVVVWGTSVSKIYGRSSFLVPRIVAALDGLGLDAVLAIDAADAQAVGPLPDGVTLLAQRTPLGALLEGCDAVIHNGAAGCVMTALAAGLPQLAVSVSDEQAGNAERIATAGAGLHVPGATSRVAGIREAVEAMLGDGAVAGAGRRLAAENSARPAPAELVGVLEDVAAGLGGPLRLKEASTRLRGGEAKVEPTIPTFVLPRSA